MPAAPYPHAIIAAHRSGPVPPRTSARPTTIRIPARPGREHSKRLPAISMINKAARGGRDHNSFSEL